MTREDVRRSLNPIQGTYTHENLTYRAILGVGVDNIEMEIRSILWRDEKYLTITKNGMGVREGYKNHHNNLDEVMKEAQSFYVNEVCSLFKLIKK